MYTRLELQRMICRGAINLQVMKHTKIVKLKAMGNDEITYGEIME
jgi:hypothetical protein